MATGEPGPRATRRDLQSALDALPGAVGFWDSDLRNRFGNRAYAEYLGTDPESLRGVHYAELVGPEAYEELLPHVALALAGEPSSLDRDVVDHHGRKRRVRCRYGPVRSDAGVDGFTVLVLDITGEYDAERAAHETALDSARLDQHTRLADQVHESVLQDLTEPVGGPPFPQAPAAADPVGVSRPARPSARPPRGAAGCGPGGSSGPAPSAMARAGPPSSRGRRR